MRQRGPSSSCRKRGRKGCGATVQYNRSIFETACGASPLAVSVALAIGVGKLSQLLEALRPDRAHLSGAGTRRRSWLCFTESPAPGLEASA